jgi:hypothetical protein
VILRSRAPRGLGGLFYHPLLEELPHFITQRGILTGLKERVESLRCSWDPAVALAWY